MEPWLLWSAMLLLAALILWRFHKYAARIEDGVAQEEIWRSQIAWYRSVGDVAMADWMEWEFNRRYR